MKRLLFALSLLLCARAASAQVGFDAAASASCLAGACLGAGSTQLQYALTVNAANSNRQLAVFTSVGCSSAQTAPLTSTVTYAGVSLAQTQHQSSVAARYVDLWTLPAGTQPATGANNVLVTLASALGVGCIATGSLKSGAISVFNVDQTTTYSSTNKAAGTSTTASVTIATNSANDLGFHSACAGSALSVPTGTSRWNAGDLNTSCNEGGGATTAGSVLTMQWTVGASDSWEIVAGAFKFAAGGAAVNPRRGLLGVGTGH